jgi:two-component system NtrC family response regulator
MMRTNSPHPVGLLAEHGYEVREAESGESALELQPEFQPDIVLLDLSLPGMDGMEVLQKLLARAPQPDCIMMTAYGTIRSAVEAMRLGACDYLAKPFDNDELLMIVERFLRVRRMMELEDLRLNWSPATGSARSSASAADA